VRSLPAAGIADAKGVAAAMALGASGVQIGHGVPALSEAVPAPCIAPHSRVTTSRTPRLTNVFSGRCAVGS